MSSTRAQYLFYIFLSQTYIKCTNFKCILLSVDKCTHLSNPTPHQDSTLPSSQIFPSGPYLVNPNHTLPETTTVVILSRPYIHFPLYKTSYSWYHRTCILLSKASVIQHDVFENCFSFRPPIFEFRARRMLPDPLKKAELYVLKLSNSKEI